MTYLELVQMVLREAGITQSETEPDTLAGVTGLTLKVKGWVAQAWSDFKLENDQSEVMREWFYATVNPRFYFDLQSPALAECFAGDVLVGQYSGCTLQVTNVIVVNNGIWADGTAQGQIEFLNLIGSPLDSEPLLIQATKAVSCRFIKWGDYKLDSQVEMQDQYISNLQDVWWESLRIADVSSNFPSSINERPLPFLDYSAFLQNYDTNVIVLGTPILVTETPDNGTRIGFWPPPDRSYRLGGYYYKTIPDLVNDDDEPQGLKTIYHAMLAWRALAYYGQYEVQANIVQQAGQRYAVFKRKFDRESELPVVLRPARLY